METFEATGPAVRGAAFEGGGSPGGGVIISEAGDRTLCLWGAALRRRVLRRLRSRPSRGASIGES